MNTSGPEIACSCHSNRIVVEFHFLVLSALPDKVVNSQEQSTVGPRCWWEREETNQGEDEGEKEAEEEEEE